MVFQQHSSTIHETNGMGEQAFLLLFAEEDCFKGGAVVTYFRSLLYEYTYPVVSWC
jgi:hypothetical protein